LTSNANLNIDNKNGQTYSSGKQFVLPTTAIVEVNGSQTYYMLVQIFFSGGINFVPENSRLQAVRVG